MADLTEQQSSQAVKLTGASTTGVESNYLQVDSHQSAQVGLYDSAGNVITASSNGFAGNQLLHVQTPDTTTATTALGALNATVSIAVAGLSSVGFQLAAGTLVGTITPQCSVDGGTTWVNVNFFDSVNSTVLTSVTFGSSNTLKVLSILPIGGSSHVRVIVSAYTSGTANAILRASEVTGVAGALTAAAFGTVSNTFPSIPGNTATLILSANSNRKYAYISNNSGSTVNIQFGSSTGLSTTTGLVLTARTYYELKGDNLFTGDIYGYCAGNVTISVTEGTP